MSPAGKPRKPPKSLTNRARPAHRMPKQDPLLRAEGVVPELPQEYKDARVGPGVDWSDWRDVLMAKVRQVEDDLP